MTKPARYIVGSFTGFEIRQATTTLRGGSQPPPTGYHVMDSLWNYRDVRVFLPGSDRRGQTYRRSQAEKLAAQLNAEHQTWIGAEYAA